MKKVKLFICRIETNIFVSFLISVCLVVCYSFAIKLSFDAGLKFTDKPVYLFFGFIAIVFVAIFYGICSDGYRNYKLNTK